MTPIELLERQIYVQNQIIALLQEDKEQTILEARLYADQVDQEIREHKFKIKAFEREIDDLRGDFPLDSGSER